MASVDDVLPLVRQYVRSCPDFVMADWIIQSARNFCRQSRYLRQSFTVPTEAGQSFYSLESQQPTEEIIALNSASYDDEPLIPSAPEESPTEAGTPQRFWYLPSREIVITPTPQDDAQDSLAVNVIVQPKVGATTLNDELVGRFDSVIANGAIHRLLKMPQTLWFNPQLVPEFKELERQGIADARVEADMQHRQFGFYSLPGF